MLPLLARVTRHISQSAGGELFFLFGAAGIQFLLLEGGDLVPFPLEFGKFLTTEQSPLNCPLGNQGISCLLG